MSTEADDTVTVSWRQKDLGEIFPMGSRQANESRLNNAIQAALKQLYPDANVDAYRDDQDDFTSARHGCGHEISDIRPVWAIVKESIDTWSNA